MNILFVGIAAVVAAGGTAGYLVYDMWDNSPGDVRCFDGPPAGEGDGEGLVRFQLDNRGPAVPVTLCVYSRGEKVVERTLTIPGEQVTFVDLVAPIGPVWGEVDVNFGSGYAQGRFSENLLFCSEKAAVIPVRILEGGGLGVGGEDAGCTDRGPPAEMKQQESLGFLSTENLTGPRMGSAVVVGLGFASLAALAVAFRGRLHFLALLLFTRLARDDVLDHEARQRIHEIVAAEPGIHATAIGDRLELGQGQLLYHLHVLERERVLTRVAAFGWRNYFVTGRYAPTQMRAMAALRLPGLGRVYEAIQAHPGRPLGQLAAHAGLSPGRVSRVSRRLEAAGLIERRVTGREVVLFPKSLPVPN